MKISFLGAIREVTGSNYLLESNGAKVVVDCGYFQGGRKSEERNSYEFDYDPASIDAVVITHAHLDHIGRLPKMIADGFKGKIYMTEVTRELARIVLEDAFSLMREPTHEASDVAKIFDLVIAVGYNQKIQIIDDIFVTFYEAGHILGSSFVKIDYQQKSIVFSGDIGNCPNPLLNDIVQLPISDYVVCESTYGSRIHEEQEEKTLKLITNISETINKNGTVLIPSFAIERTQELLYELDTIFDQQKLPKVPFYLDSPMAIDVTKIYKKYPNYWNASARDSKLKDGDIFKFPSLIETITTEQSKSINNVKGAKVIIAGAGMMDGGRIVHHAKRYIGDPKNLILFVGYQAEGTLGRQIYDGEKSVKIDRERYTVRCNTKAIGGYSAHADSQQISKWLDNGDKNKQIYLTHGELTEAEGLQKKLLSSGYKQVTIPNLKDCIEL